MQSLSDLLNVQNDLLSVWVNFQVQRLGLEFDLGVMQIAPDGQYIPQQVPLASYLAGACVNMTDIYPGIEVFEPVDAEPLPAEAVIDLPDAEPIPTDRDKEKAQLEPLELPVPLEPEGE